MKKLNLFLAAILMLSVSMRTVADEGMWIPSLLGYNYEDMKAKGFKLSPEDVYSINNESLKDAIVIFGRGCTGEMVSNQGLLFTNHHCGFRQIQKHSSLEHDYLTDGFWAMEQKDELPNPGLTASLLIRMEDVSTRVFEGVEEKMTIDQRNKIIGKNIEGIINEATDGTHYEAQVKPLYYGNQYFLYIYEVFKDVRLVGAPPSAIGKFGGDTDNWMWPRHTGDFSLFRIYVGKDNKPAEYSEDNIPYEPKKHLEISMKGVKEGDFTMVFGYPYTTEEYLPSYAVELRMNQLYPDAVKVRDRELAIINAAMESDKQLRIKYAAKQAGIANAWKKWKGVIKGLEYSNALQQKVIEERKVMNYISEDRGLFNRYGSLFKEYKKQYHDLAPLKSWEGYFNECFWKQPLLRYVFKAYPLVRMKEWNQEGAEKVGQGVIAAAPGYFKDSDPETEKKLLAAMIEVFIESIPEDQLPPAVLEVKNEYKGDYYAFADKALTKSYFATTAKAEKFFGKMSEKKVKKLKKDILFSFYLDIIEYYLDNYHQKINDINHSIDSLHRVYMEVRMKHMPELIPYPDANATLRVAYGNVKGAKPKDGVTYKYYTTLDGIMQKDNPDVYDYRVPARLKELWAEKDFGRYNVNGTVPVAFIATNHTTGGNSGSPVLDAEGRLIGINFDRAWEGTMSDINYDPEICRNITLDIRYCLFIIDKYANAQRLIQEMTIVE